MKLCMIACAKSLRTEAKKRMNTALLSIEDLKRLNDMEIAVDNMGDEIAQLNALLVSPKGIDYERAGQGGSAGEGAENAEERRRVATMDRIAYLTPNYAYKRGKVKRIHLALSRLTDAERRVLWVFYVNRPPNNVQVLCEELNIGKSEVYRIERRAKNRFAEMMYGLVEG